MPIRKIPKNSRSVTGVLNGDKSIGPSEYESPLERDLYRILEFDLNVDRYEVQPVHVEFRRADGSLDEYTPDVVIHYRKDLLPAAWFKTQLVEVKPRKDLWEHWGELLPKVRAARRYAAERGWQFRILTEKEIRTPYLLNVKFLHPFRRQPSDGEAFGEIEKALVELRESTPEALLAMLRNTQMARAELLPELWRMVAEGYVLMDLTLPLTMQSPIWLPPADYKFSDWAKAAPPLYNHAPGRRSA